MQLLVTGAAPVFMRNKLPRNAAQAKLWPALPLAKLLSPAHRKTAVIGIFQESHTNERYFNELYRGALESFARLVQQLPASEVDHHATPGGLLDHALESTLNALRIRRAHMLPANAPPEEVSRQESLWTYAVFCATLVHDVAKIATDQRIILYDRKKQPLSEPWSPFEGFIDQRTNWYSIEFRRDRQYALHQRTAALLAPCILPAKGLAWLTANTEVFAAFSAAITGHLEDAGVLGQIVTEADRLSVARNNGVAQGTYMAARTKPLHEKLLSALRVLIDRGDLALNRPGAAGWLTQEGLWMMGTRTVSSLRQHLTEEGHSGIPSSNSRLFDELMQHGIVTTNSDKAIWRIQVTQGKWSPDPFTVLRLPPEKIWPLAEQRPTLFDGSVAIVSDPPLEEGETKQAVAVIGTPSPKNDKPGEQRPPGSSPTSLSTESSGKTETGQPAPSPWFNGVAKEEITESSSEATDLSAVPKRTPFESSMQDEKGEGEKGDATKVGEVFFEWLRTGLQTNHIRYNDAATAVHVVEAGVLLVSPAIFRRFIRENPDYESWENVQKHVQRLRLNEKTPEKTNIHVYRVQGENRAASKLKGFLIPDKAMLFGDKIPNSNPYLTPTTESK